ITDAQALDVADQIKQGWEHEIVDEGACVDAVVIPLGDLIIGANGHGYSHCHMCSSARSSSDKQPLYSLLPQYYARLGVGSNGTPIQLRLMGHGGGIERLACVLEGCRPM